MSPRSAISHSGPSRGLAPLLSENSGSDAPIRSEPTRVEKRASRGNAPRLLAMLSLLWQEAQRSLEALRMLQ
jgi:hypothetical protein